MSIHEDAVDVEQNGNWFNEKLQNNRIPKRVYLEIKPNEYLDEIKSHNI